MNINNQKIKDHEYFRRILGQSLPSISCLPNIVMPTTSKVIKYILRSITRKGCICFNEPPYDRTDYVYEDAKYLYLWAKKENQNYLMENGCYYPQFVIDANTDINLLSLLNNTDTDLFTYLVNNIEQYRWFYMPMSDEVSVSIFICRMLDKQWIIQIAQKFDNVGIPYTQIISQGNRDTWRLNNELRDIWKII
jgi:hypothetical protein